jgi:hypothetical protein
MPRASRTSAHRLASLLGQRGEASRRRLRRVFLDAFEALDVAEPLRSFDATAPAAEVRAALEARGFDRVGVRVDGQVRGWAERGDLAGGTLGEHLRPFGPDDLVADTASLQEVIQSLAVNDRCFVTVLGEAAAIVTRQDLEKPPVRMFLFGMITLLELLMTRAIEEAWPDEGWRAEVAPGRLAKAEALRAERERRGRPVGLLDCLQLSDKGQLALRLPQVAEGFALGQSRKASLRALKELEELRNHLAHSQEIIPTGWARIATFTRRLDRLLEAV